MLAVFDSVFVVTSILAFSLPLLSTAWHQVKHVGPFEIGPFMDNLMCGTEEQVMNENSYAKMVFVDSIKRETNSQ